jgi:hypothetical protein
MAARIGGEAANQASKHLRARWRVQPWRQPSDALGFGVEKREVRVGHGHVDGLSVAHAPSMRLRT